jgi:MFS family permease
VSGAVTTHFLLSAAVVTFLPELHRTFGIARVTAAGGVLVALGICSWGSVGELWQLFPAAALSGSGFALVGGAAITAMVARWFDRDRPKALSTALNGASVGGVVFAPLWVFLIAHIGFRWATVVVGAAMACIVVLLALRFLRLGPSDLGLPPDGRPLAATVSRPMAALSRAALLHNWRFATLSLPFAFGLFAQIGVLPHLVARLAPELGKDGAAAMLSLTTACAVLGRIALGWTIGEYNRRLVAALNFLVQAAGALLLGLASSPALSSWDASSSGWASVTSFRCRHSLLRPSSSPQTPRRSWRS